MLLNDREWKDVTNEWLTSHENVGEAPNQHFIRLIRDAENAKTAPDYHGWFTTSNLSPYSAEERLELAFIAGAEWGRREASLGDVQDWSFVTKDYPEFFKWAESRADEMKKMSKTKACAVAFKAGQNLRTVSEPAINRRAELLELVGKTLQGLLSNAAVEQFRQIFLDTQDRMLVECAIRLARFGIDAVDKEVAK